MPASKVPRRTQAQRRARTREALLAATIDVLVAAGYAGVTTRAVAERAGVSIGALQHHFESKSELVAAAIEHLGVQLTREVVAGAPTASRSEHDLAEQLLDAMWESHKGPLMAAMAELSVAARSDPELRDRLAPVPRHMIAASSAGAAYVFPKAGAKRVAALMDTALAAMRGLALLRFVDVPAADAMWPATRAHLMTLAFGPAEGKGT